MLSIVPMVCYVFRKILNIDLIFVDVVWLFLFVSVYWWGGLSY